jgi:hypothetical protein
LVCLSILLFPNSYTIIFLEFYFLTFYVHAQTNVIFVSLLSLLWWNFKNCINLLLVNILQFSFSFSYTGSRILLYTFLSKMFNYFLFIFVSIEFSDAYVNVLSIIVFFSINFSFLYMFLFLKNVCSIKPSHYSIIQGDSLARGPKLLSIKHQVMEIMT